MPKYKIIGNKIQLWDSRFDHYSNETLSFFSKLESLIGSPPSLALTATQELIEWQNKRWEEFEESVENCRHKIQAINYSISLIESEIKNPPIPNLKSLPMNLDKKEFFDDVILFEFESFLFQALSLLDVFVHLLKLFYLSLDDEKNRIGFNGKKGVAGRRTTNALRGSGDSDLANYIDSQVTAWIQEVYDLRNISAHRSKVKNLQMFLIDKNEINAPKFSDSEKNLLKYCKETYENLKKFINTIEEDFLLVKAENFYEMK